MRPVNSRLAARLPQLLGSVVVFLAFAALPLHGQQPVNPTQPATPSSPEQQRKKTPPVAPGSVLPSYNSTKQQTAVKVQAVPTSPNLEGWAGRTVVAIHFEGVSQSVLDPLPAELEQQPSTALDPVKVRASLRRLYATGLYKTIAVDGEPQDNGIVLTFKGTPTLFIGRILVRGVKNSHLNNQLNYSTRLMPGTPYTDQKMDRAERFLQQALQQNGYYQATIVHHTAVDKTNAEIDVQFNVTPGKQARVGDVAVQGDSGMTVPAFRKQAKLKSGSKVNLDTVSRALSRVRKRYQKQERLEANVSLASTQFHPPANHLDYNFDADRGPIIKIVVEGAKLSKGKVKTLVPVYSEGTLDEDLLNEGSKRIRDYYQRQGYFNAKVTHSTDAKDGVTHIAYDVNLGPRNRIEAVNIQGNGYFGAWLLKERISVQPASLFIRHGIYSQALQEADVDAITALYQSNGFTDVKVTPEVHEAPHQPNKSREKPHRHLQHRRRSAEEGRRIQNRRHNSCAARCHYSPARLAEWPALLRQ